MNRYSIPVQVMLNPLLKSQHSILFSIIERNGGLSSGCKYTDLNFSKYLNSPEHSISNLIKTLGRNGYLKIDDNGDRRVLFIDTSFYTRYSFMSELDILDGSLDLPYTSDIFQALTNDQNKELDLVPLPLKVKPTPRVVSTTVKKAKKDWVEDISDAFLGYMPDKFKTSKKFIHTYTEFKRHRKELIPARPFTSRSEIMALKVLINLSIPAAIKNIEACIKKGYQTIYLVEDRQRSFGKKEIAMKNTKFARFVREQVQSPSLDISRLNSFSDEFYKQYKTADEYWDKYYGGDCIGWLSAEAVLSEYNKFINKKYNDAKKLGHYNPDGVLFKEFAQWYDNEYIKDINFLTVGFSL